jgi:hypothetical protein
MIKYIFQGILILACINICHMGWVYFNKLQTNRKKQGIVNTDQVEKINATIDEVIDERNKSAIPEIEFCQVESDLEEFMKSIILD